MTKLSGVIPAIPTPLLENEDVDVDSLKRIIDHVIEEGASGVFVLGNMGEGPALLDSQKLIAVEKAVGYIDSRVPLLAGIADVSPRRMVELGKKVKALRPDYMVVTTPYFYNFPHPDSIYGAIKKAASELDYPIVFYNCPGATGNKVSLETMLRIFDIGQVAAVKDSSGDKNLFLELLRRYPDSESRPCAILQGDEFVYDMSLLMGADGVVTGGGTVFVDTLVQLYKAAKDGNKVEAFKLQQKFRGQMDDMLGDELIIDWMYAIKTKLKEKGLCDNNVTFPFMKRKQ